MFVGLLKQKNKYILLTVSEYYNDFYSRIYEVSTIILRN